MKLDMPIKRSSCCLRLLSTSVFLLLFPITAANASIESDLNAFFQQFGANSNVTASEIYRSQSAGYYTGGSLSVRGRIRQVPLATLQLPSFRGGCGGIDLFTGGFSFINSQALIDALKNVANNATSYAFMLAIETVSPMIAEQMKHLQNLANQINQTNINSCETAASLVGGLWPKTDVAQKQVCAAIGTSQGLFSDWAQARQQCGSGGERSQTLLKGHQDISFQDMVAQNTNIAWLALQKHAFLKADPALAELLLSLSGTIILSQQGDTDDAKQQWTYYASLANDQSLIHALLAGGDVLLYHCDEQVQCLQPQRQKVHIEESHALGTQVKTLLQGMLAKIKQDLPLNAAEISFLQATSLPLYKLLNVHAAYAEGTSPLDILAYSDGIANDLILRYLRESLQIVLQSSQTLNLPEALLQHFQQGIASAEEQLVQLRHQTASDYQTMATLIQRAELIEKQLASQLASDLQSSLQWANGLY